MLLKNSMVGSDGRWKSFSMGFDLFSGGFVLFVSRGGSFQDDMFIVHLPTCGPPKPWKMKVLHPKYMGYNPKNEGCGFPWKKPTIEKVEAFHQLYSVHSWPQSSSLPQSLAQRRLEQAHQKSVAKEASGHWEKQKHQGCVHCSYVVVIQKEVWELGLFEFFFCGSCKTLKDKTTRNCGHKNMMRVVTNL